MERAELDEAVAELARQLCEDLAAGPPDDVRERVIERYVYAVVNEHLQAMLAARPLPPEDESLRRLEAALAHAAEAAGLPREAVERYRKAAQQHWRANEGLARGLGGLHAFYERLAALNKRIAVALTLPPLWGLPVGARKAEPETPPPRGPSAPELPAKPADELPPRERPAKPEPAFPERAAWLRRIMHERALSINALSQRRRAPDAKTLTKILRGEAVREDVLERLAEVLKVARHQIPDD
jgi:hypothetical protein